MCSRLQARRDSPGGPPTPGSGRPGPGSARPAGLGAAEGREPRVPAPSRAALRALPALAVLGSALLGSCGDAPRLPTVVLVTLDTTRADHLSTYGYGRETDPRLRELADRSRVFENAFPSGTWTLPSHATLFTGLDPVEHGAWRKVEGPVHEARELSALDPATPRFTDRLLSAGYHLAGAVGGPFTTGRFGFARGFHEWFEPDPGTFQATGEEIDRFLFSVLDERAERGDDRPLFLFVNYFDAHAPYDAPDAIPALLGGGAYGFPDPPRELPAVDPLEEDVPPELVRDAVDQYDRELRVQDAALGTLLDRLEADGLLDHALVVVTADHGEMFGEASTFGHGCLPYEGVARVPLVVHRSPGGPVDRIAQPVSNANVPATIVGALGLEPLRPAGALRVDLLAPDPEATLAAGPTPYVEHRGGEEWFGVLRGPRFKYLSELGEPDGGPGSDRVELVIDLATNPEERHEPAAGPEAARAERALEAELDALRARWRPAARRASVRIEDPAALEALGY